MLSLLKRKERQDVLGEDVGAVEPPLMKHAVNNPNKSWVNSGTSLMLSICNGSLMFPNLMVEVDHERQQNT